uniref:Large ribosomal subunit protein uL24c n=1 Tax=Sheathia arcuata TaxID=340433 RepID=A0A3G1I923_9FLOR|nr:50S ribosomal protein L24 [Sheathia arcuata]ART65444.1 50S ribosomal protein L24 [Sheathia arcuata]
MPKLINFINKKNKIHVKQGDQIKIIAGIHKGKIGIVAQVLHKTKKVIIKDINTKTKHNKPRQEGESGTITIIESPIDSSNVMLYDSVTQIASRYKTIINTQGIKVRVLKKINIESNNKN